MDSTTGLTIKDYNGLIEIRENNMEQFERAKDKALARALEAIGLKAEEYAKKACPVDTGRLRNSITHQTKEEEVLVGTNVEYAAYVETDDRKAHTNGKAHFLRDAAAQHADTYRQILEKYLGNA